LRGGWGLGISIAARRIRPLQGSLTKWSPETIVYLQRLTSAQVEEARAAYRERQRAASNARRKGVKARSRSASCLSPTSRWRLWRYLLVCIAKKRIRQAQVGHAPVPVPGCALSVLEITADDAASKTSQAPGWHWARPTYSFCSDRRGAGPALRATTALPLPKPFASYSAQRHFI